MAAIFSRCTQTPAFALDRSAFSMRYGALRQTRIRDSSILCTKHRTLICNQMTVSNLRRVLAYVFFAQMHDWVSDKLPRAVKRNFSATLHLFAQLLRAPTRTVLGKSQRLVTADAAPRRSTRSLACAPRYTWADAAATKARPLAAGHRFGGRRGVSVWPMRVRTPRAVGNA